MISCFVKTPLPQITLLEPSQIPPDFTRDSGEWLAHRFSRFLGENEIGYALIHADDGVIWGRLAGGRLEVPNPDDWVPALRTGTVQQCRVFGRQGELFIWRESEGEWRGRELFDEKPPYEVITENHILWGNRAKPVNDGFTPIFEEGLGLHQVVPLAVTPSDFGRDDKLRVMLTVGHYLSEDEDGQCIVVCSRLKEIGLRPPRRD
jgi:CRISPR-associated protein (TIGR03984 family)